MNRGLRRAGYVLSALFCVLILNLGWIQVIDAEDISANSANETRRLEREFSVRRGPILSADGATLAESVPNPDGPFPFRRTYKEPELMASVVGFQSLSRTFLVEHAYNDILQGADKPLTRSSLTERLDGKVSGNAVTLTLRRDVQATAATALDGRVGAVFALNPRTGAVLASYSNPTYDPNVLTTQRSSELAQAARSLEDDPARPMLPRAFRENYPPGSTFKIVVAASALEGGIATPEAEFPEQRSIPLPGSTNVISNFGGSACGGSLIDSFARSCNTVFAQLAADIGVDRLGVTAKAFGFDQKPDFELGAAESVFVPSSGLGATAQLMQSGIGQYEVKATPMEMALVAAAVANGGAIMVPQVVAEVRDEKANVISALKPQEFQRAVPPEIAATLSSMMVEVVQRGTGRSAQIEGITVAGKTGTAQAGATGELTHAWFTGFAPAEDPQVAVAVFVFDGGSGGAVAGPIAKAVIQTALGRD